MAPQKQTSPAIARARELRHNGTNAEMRLWEKIKSSQLGHKFRRQTPIGPYIADFMCWTPKLIVEVDGGQHCENRSDEARTAYFEKLGFKVIRFWNNEVLENMEGVLITLSQALQSHSALKTGGV